MANILAIFVLTLATGYFVLGDNQDEKVEKLEGDIEGIAPALMRGDSSSKKARWPHNTIPYTLEKDYPKDLKKLFTQAILHISKHTCMKFVRRTNQKDYVYVTAKKSGCTSYVGRMGGVQTIKLGRKCNKLGTFVHELLHAIGFEHEQSRYDRNKFVTINWNNVEPGEEHNFEKHAANVGKGFPYDYGSVMHYSKTAFAKDSKKDTITPRKKGVQIGQRVGMSKGDIDEVNKMYCKGKKTGKRQSVFFDDDYIY